MYLRTGRQMTTVLTDTLLYAPGQGVSFASKGFKIGLSSPFCPIIRLIALQNLARLTRAFSFL